MANAQLKPDVATMTMARLDEAISRHKRELSDLRSKRNSLSLVFRLPTEILQAIFVHLARDSYVECQGASRLTVPDWVNVSYVCRHWRDVTLDSSTLWSYLFILSPRWTEELLARSKAASLKVDVDLRIDASPRASRFLEQVVKQAECIQELRLCLATHTFHVVVPLLSSRVPRLTNLSISATSNRPWDWPLVLFDGDTPMLRTLDVTHCITPLHSLNVTGLTALNISDVLGQVLPDTVDFLAMLRPMHHLTHLNLYHFALARTTSFISSAAFKSFQKVDLPHLSHLQINAPVSTVIALLQCLNIPLKTLVRLGCTPDPDFSLRLDDYKPLLSLLSHRLNASSDAQALSTPIIRSLKIRFEPFWAQLTLERGCHDTPRTLWDPNVPLEIDLDERERGQSWNNVDSCMSDICCSLPLMNVQRLCVSRPPLSSTFWRRILGHLQEMRYLKLDRGPIPDLTPLLSDSNGEDRCGPSDPSYEIPRYAPALQTLELCNVLFNHPKATSRDMPCLTEVQPLYDALARRRGSQGLLVVNHCIVIKDGVMEFDMVGRWEDGHFRVTEEHTGPRQQAQLDPEDEQDLEGLEEEEESEDPESDSDVPQDS